MRILETMICKFCGKKLIKTRYDQITCGSKECLLKLRKQRTTKVAQKSKEIGLCLHCFAKPQEFGTLCAICAEKSQKRGITNQKSRREQGICVQCGKNPVIDGKKMCSDCADKFKEYAKKSREKNSEKRRTVICSNCGELKLHHAKGLCNKCYYKQKYNKK